MTMTKDEALRGLTIGDCRTRREAVKTVKELLNREECEDAISRQAVLDYIHRILNQGTGKKKSFEFIQKYVEKLPSVNPQPKTGHWIKDDITERSKSAYKHKCDRCGAYHRAMYDYCPSCGAKMVEPQERSGKE